MEIKKYSGTTERIEAVDFTKGILVIFMVIYHSLNHYRIFPYRYLPFVPPSFIMITGFIITQIYFPRYNLNINRMRKRLAVRSLKLFFIFSFLNLAALMIWPRYYNGISLDYLDFLEDWVPIYLIGNPQMAAFDILLPISYTLFLSIFIPKLKLATPFIILSSAIGIFVASILIQYLGNPAYNLGLVGSGFIGMAIGLLPLTLINTFARSWIRIILLLLSYGICSFFYYYIPSMQTILTIIALGIIYTIGIKVNLKYIFQRQIILLGRYSLLSYIIQIAYLKSIFTLIKKWQVGKPNILIIIFLITLMTYTSILILDYARPRFKYVDKFYKIIFA
jgi:hypothetical protein